MGKSIEKLYNAGPKARKDIINILGENRKDYFFEKNRFLSKFTQGITLSICNFPKTDISVIQYPFFIKNKYYRNVAKKLLIKKRTIVIIHDLESLRRQMELKKVQEEINELNKYDVIISHNAKMTMWLKENGCTKPIIDLEIFDYLYDNKQIQDKINKNIISFAGNLTRRKSPFIYMLNKIDSLEFNLYGQGFEESKGNNLIYKGTFAPDFLPNEIKSGFGLIWDGKTIETCSGEFGEYLKFNNPHKCSLYLASGIPVIIWEEAALAKFVSDNNLGIVIKDLNLLEYEINKISDQQYINLKKNAEEVSKKLVKGFYFKAALEKAFKLLRENSERI